MKQQTNSQSEQCPISLRDLIFYGAEKGIAVEVSEEQVYHYACAMGWKPRKPSTDQ